MTRSGDEPSTARSALRLRAVLAGFGALCGLAGAVAFGLADRTGAELAFACLGLLATINLTVVLRHIRQGPHWQPGADVPPYRRLQTRTREDELLDGVPPAGARPHRVAPPVGTRLRRYLVMMAGCLGLLVVAWTLVGDRSLPWAVALTVLAMLVPPAALFLARP